MSCENTQQDSTVASGIIQHLLSTSLVSNTFWPTHSDLSVMFTTELWMLIPWKKAQKMSVCVSIYVCVWLCALMNNTYTSCVFPPGHRPAFLLPDRSKYVNMEKRFLSSYMDLLVQTCHRRGALATGGMAALLLPQDTLSDSYRRVLAAVTR